MGRAYESELCLPDLEGAQLEEAFQLLEMERFAMLMFTSCAWFFDEISRIEPTQNLRYAARAIEMALLFSQQDLEEELVRDLEKAPSNKPEVRNGKGVWEQSVRPHMQAD